MNSREGTQNAIAILRNATAHGTAGKLLHGDQLTFDQRDKLAPVGDLVGGVLDQH